MFMIPTINEPIAKKYIVDVALFCIRNKNTIVENAI